MNEQDIDLVIAASAARHEDRGDLVDSFLAGEPLMISLPPAAKRRFLREALIRKAVEDAQDRQEISRRLGGGRA